MFEDFREWLITKLNPAQGAIWGSESIASPRNIVTWETAYREIEVINRAVNIIISSAVDIPLKVEPIQEGRGAIKKVDKLLNHSPNPFEDRVRFFRRAFLDFMLDGNAFFYYDGTNLFLLPANDVEIIADSKTFVSHYEYLINDTSNELGFGFSNTVSRGKKTDTITFSPEEIIHVKGDSELSIYRGESKIQSLDRIIEIYYFLTDFQNQFFKNNAIPGLVLTTDNVLSTKIKTRLLEQWRMSYTTLFNGARSPAILDGGLKIDKFSQLTFQELDFEKSVERLQQDMAKGLGVPFVLLKSGNNANLAANQVVFFTHTILPMLEQFTSAFSHFFQIEIKPDVHAVNVLRPDIKILANYWATLVNAGIATPAEAREELRLTDMNDEELNKIRVPQNITGSATNPSLGGRPSPSGSQTESPEGENDG